jgi:membrane fusion protein (multidrug efflux system)
MSRQSPQVSVYLVTAAISVLFLSGCMEKKQAASQGPQVIPVRAEKVKVMDLSRKLEYIGSVKAQDEILVYSKVTGKVIEKVKDEGMPVEKGEAIAYIDRDEVGLKFEKAPVESPVSGVVGRMYVDIGSSILPGGATVFSQTPVALVLNMDKVKINLDIPEIYLPKIFLDQEASVNVDAYPQKEFKGRISQISPVVNLENRAAPVEITIDNKEHLLKSGMFVEVVLVIEKHEQVAVILKEAIIGKGPDTYVYVIEHEKAALRKISLGIHDGPLYEAAEGLKAEELVVIVGQQRLYDGAQVTVEMGNGNGKAATE